MNKWKKRWIPIFMALMLIFSGCGEMFRKNHSHRKIRQLRSNNRKLWNKKIGKL